MHAAEKLSGLQRESPDKITLHCRIWCGILSLSCETKGMEKINIYICLRYQYPISSVLHKWWYDFRQLNTSLRACACLQFAAILDSGGLFIMRHDSIRQASSNFRIYHNALLHSLYSRVEITSLSTSVRQQIVQTCSFWSCPGRDFSTTVKQISRRSTVLERVTQVVHWHFCSLTQKLGLKWT